MLKQSMMISRLSSPLPYPVVRNRMRVRFSIHATNRTFYKDSHYTTSFLNSEYIFPTWGRIDKMHNKANFNDGTYHAPGDVFYREGLEALRKTRPTMCIGSIPRTRMAVVPNRVNDDLNNVYTMYVLVCENGKFYVGMTSNREQRFKEHWEGKGAKWTQTNKPIKILKEYDIISKDLCLALEAQVTAQYMFKYGINNVRGAMYTRSDKYTMKDFEVLSKFLGHHNNVSYNEILKNLQDTLREVSSPLSTPQSALWPRSKLPTSLLNSNRMSRLEVRCFCCGRIGHWSIHCPKNH